MCLWVLTRLVGVVVFGPHERLPLLLERLRRDETRRTVLVHLFRLKNIAWSLNVAPYSTHTQSVMQSKMRHQLGYALLTTIRSVVARLHMHVHTHTHTHTNLAPNIFVPQPERPQLDRTHSGSTMLPCASAEPPAHLTPQTTVHAFILSLSPHLPPVGVVHVDDLQDISVCERETCVT